MNDRLIAGGKDAFKTVFSLNYDHFQVKKAFLSVVFTVTGLVVLLIGLLLTGVLAFCGVACFSSCILPIFAVVLLVGFVFLGIGFGFMTNRFAMKLASEQESARLFCGPQHVPMSFSVKEGIKAIHNFFSEMDVVICEFCDGYRIDESYFSDIRKRIQQIREILSNQTLSSHTVYSLFYQSCQEKKNLLRDIQSLKDILDTSNISDISTLINMAKTSVNHVKGILVDLTEILPCFISLKEEIFQQKEFHENQMKLKEQEIALIKFNPLCKGIGFFHRLFVKKNTLEKELFKEGEEHFFLLGRRAHYYSLNIPKLKHLKNELKSSSSYFIQQCIRDNGSQMAEHAGRLIALKNSLQEISSKFVEFRMLSTTLSGQDISHIEQMRVCEIEKQKLLDNLTRLIGKIPSDFLKNNWETVLNHEIFLVKETVDFWFQLGQDLSVIPDKNKMRCTLKEKYRNYKQLISSVEERYNFMQPAYCEFCQIQENLKHLENFFMSLVPLLEIKFKHTSRVGGKKTLNLEELCCLKDVQNRIRKLVNEFKQGHSISYEAFDYISGMCLEEFPLYERFFKMLGKYLLLEESLVGRDDYFLKSLSEKSDLLLSNIVSKFFNLKEEVEILASRIEILSDIEFGLQNMRREEQQLSTVMSDFIRASKGVLSKAESLLSKIKGGEAFWRSVDNSGLLNIFKLMVTLEIGKLTSENGVANTTFSEQTTDL